jgi:hypothetical protein
MAALFGHRGADGLRAATQHPRLVCAAGRQQFGMDQTAIRSSNSWKSLRSTEAISAALHQIIARDERRIGSHRPGQRLLKGPAAGGHCEKASSCNLSNLVVQGLQTDDVQKVRPKRNDCGQPL